MLSFCGAGWSLILVVLGLMVLAGKGSPLPIMQAVERPLGVAGLFAGVWIFLVLTAGR